MPSYLTLLLDSSYRDHGLERGIIEEAGGRIYAANRSQPGARLEIELPVRNR